MRRRLLAALVAVQLALGGAVIVRQTTVRPTTIVQPSPCVGLDPDINWFQWWWYGCTDGSVAGGGGGGAW